MNRRGFLGALLALPVAGVQARETVPLEDRCDHCAARATSWASDSIHWPNYDTMHYDGAPFGGVRRGCDQHPASKHQSFYVGRAPSLEHTSPDELVVTYEEALRMKDGWSRAEAEKIRSAFAGIGPKAIR